MLKEQTVELQPSQSCFPGSEAVREKKQPPKPTARVSIRVGELRKGLRAGAWHACTHIRLAVSTELMQFFVSYLSNRPLGMQPSETHENQRERRAQALLAQRFILQRSWNEDKLASVLPHSTR